MAEVERLGVVLYAHRIVGSSFAHLPFSSVEPLLEPIEDYLVRDFSLVVAL